MAKCYVSALLAVARSEVGYREKATNSALDDPAANAGSGNYTKYARDFDTTFPGWFNGKKQGFDWCDVFVDWCFLRAFGYADALRLLCQPEKSCGAGCYYSLGYFKSKGRFSAFAPAPGDQIFFGSDFDHVTHTGIVESVDDDIIITIEGNKNNAVTRCTYSRDNSSILGYGHPAFDVEPMPEAQESTEDMITRVVRAAVADALSAPLYNSVEDMPAWARDDIAYLCGRDLLRGDTHGSLKLTLSEVRLLCVISRGLRGAADV